jgi:polyhydroxyalkanoate synthesis repressor PhaR
MAQKTAPDDPPVTIKKYANRRLYNTATSSYVTLDHLAQMVKDGTDFVVYDAKSGDDITRAVLTQIIMEEESKGDSLLPISFLRQLISFYGDSLGGVVPRYLELSMETFTRNQDRMRSQLGDGFGGFFPFKQLEEMGKTNMKMFQNAMEMFTPGATGETPVRNAKTRDEGAPNDGARDAGKRNDPGGSGSVGGDDGALDALRHQLDAMQRQLNEIAKKDAPKKDAPKKDAK